MDLISLHFVTSNNANTAALPAEVSHNSLVMEVCIH